MKSLKNIFILKTNRKRGIHTSKRDLQLKIAEWIYPSIGIRGWFKYTFLSLKRKPMSSHKIALGFAIGTFVSFTPFIGLHGLFAIIFCYIFSASIITALIGTIVGNPWTFPLIWAWTLSFGNFILNNKGKHYTQTTVNFNLNQFLDNISLYWDKYLFPMTVGGVPTGILAALCMYFVLKYQIDKFRDIRKKIIDKRKAEIRHRKLHKLKEIKDKILN